ncbi:MAG: thermonuclease family protein [Pseudomonadota bacterium]
MARAFPSLLIASLVAACGPGAPPYLCEADSRCVEAAPGEVTAIDGDTFEFVRTLEDRDSRATGRFRLRLIGWDSPESGAAAACPAEAALGLKVEARAKALVAAAEEVVFLPVGNDEYGRFRVHLFLDRVHVGHLLRKEGLAAHWDEDAGAPKPDWCG